MVTPLPRHGKTGDTRWKSGKRWEKPPQESAFSRGCGSGRGTHAKGHKHTPPSSNPKHLPKPTSLLPAALPRPLSPPREPQHPPVVNPILTPQFGASGSQSPPGSECSDLKETGTLLGPPCSTTDTHPRATDHPKCLRPPPTQHGLRSLMRFPHFLPPLFFLFFPIFFPFPPFFPSFPGCLQGQRNVGVWGAAPTIILPHPPANSRGRSSCRG